MRTGSLEKMEEAIRNSSVAMNRDTMIMVENIMTITHCSEEEAVSTLLDCKNDPHQAIIDIIEKGEFQEVKSRQKKKKKMCEERIKDAVELCPPFPRRASDLTRGRVVFYQSASSESSFIRDPQKTNSLLLAQPKFAPDEDLYPCFTCPAFNPFTLDKLKVHNKEDHPLCKIKCSVCFNVFDTNKALLTHKKSMSHEFQRKVKTLFRCVHCTMSKTYWSVGELDKHTQVHGRYKYRCNLCKNLFATETARSVHKPNCACAAEVNALEEGGGSDLSDIDELNDEENEEESGEEKDEE